MEKWGISATISEGCFGSLQEGGDGVEYFHMLDMTLEQGRQIFLKTLTGNNFSTESIRAYNADITQFHNI